MRRPARSPQDQYSLAFTETWKEMKEKKKEWLTKKERIIKKREPRRCRSEIRRRQRKKIPPELGEWVTAARPSQFVARRIALLHPHPLLYIEGGKMDVLIGVDSPDVITSTGPVCAVRGWWEELLVGERPRPPMIHPWGRESRYIVQRVFYFHPPS